MLVIFFARDLLEGNSENTNIALPKDGRPNMPHNQTPKSAILFRLVIKVFAGQGFLRLCQAVQHVAQKFLVVGNTVVDH